MQPARSHFLRPRPRFGASLAAIALGAAGCFLGDTGQAPPLETPYYPTAIVVSPGGSALYLVNSDFDLQYNGGTVQVIDLAELRKQVLTPLLESLRNIPNEAADPKNAGKDLAALACSNVVNPWSKTALGRTAFDPQRSRSLQKNDNRILTPSPCTPIAPPVKNSATIGAFASGAVLAHNPDGDGARLFVTVRGDPSITWFDVSDDRPGKPLFAPCGGDSAFCLGCAAVGEDQRCGDSHRTGIDPYQNLRHLTMPVEPVGIDVLDPVYVRDASGNPTSILSALAVAHQTELSVSLSLNDWAQTSQPRLEFVLTNLGDGPTEVAHVPMPRLVRALDADPATRLAYEPGFLATYRNTPQVDLFRYTSDAGSNPPRPFLTRVSQNGITVNADGKDSRGIAIDASARRACEDTCAPADLLCMRACVDIPLDVYIANRSPASLVLGHVWTEIVEDADSGPFGAAASDSVEIYGTVSLAVGPSKVGVGQVIGPDGKLHPRVFTVAFDSRYIFSYDPEAGAVDAVIRTGRGPHAIAFDHRVDPADPTQDHAYLLVAHFADSYIGVVDLDMRQPETFGTMFASVGTPIAPRESR